MDASKFQARAIGALILAVQIKILSKEYHSRFFLKVHLAENLEVANIGYGIRPEVLRMEFEKWRTSLKNFEPGGEKPRFM